MHTFKKTRLRSAFALVIPMLAGLAACSTMDVQTAKDPGVNLARYKTYAWLPQQDAQSKTGTISVKDQTIRDSVDQQLTAKGLKMVPSGQADLFVSYSAGARNTWVNTQPTSGTPWAPAYSTGYTERTGALTLSLSNPATNKAVWEGTATSFISDAGASQKDISDAVKQLLKDYPVLS